MNKRKRVLILSVVIVVASLLIGAVALKVYAEEKQFDGKKVLTKVEFPKRIAGDQFGTTKVKFKDGTFKILSGVHPLLKNYEGEAVEKVEANFENGIWVSYIALEPK